MIPYQHKVIIAGNHNISLDKACIYRSALARPAGTCATPEETDFLIATMERKNIIYLSPENLEAEIPIGGSILRIHGLPFSLGALHLP